MYEHTPEAVTKDILDLCNQIVHGVSPVFVNVKPVHQAEKLDCFINVERHCQSNGGEISYGWRIWEWPPIMLEAEFHAVWKNQNGEYVDITPLDNPETSILFLPDNTKTYKGFSVNNIRYPLQDDPLLDEFISICDDIFAVMNKGDRKYQHGVLAIPAEEIEPLQESKIHYQLSLTKKYLRDEDPCPCGSGKMSMYCHPIRKK